MKLYIYIRNFYFRKALVNNWVQTIERKSVFKYGVIGVLFFCVLWSSRQSFAMNGTNGESIRHPLETNSYEEPTNGADAMDSSQGELTNPSSVGETISLPSSSSLSSLESEINTPPPYTPPPPYSDIPPPYSLPNFFYLSPQHPDINNQEFYQPSPNTPPPPYESNYRRVGGTLQQSSYSSCRNSTCLTLAVSGISSIICSGISHAICNNIGCTLTFGSVGCIGCCFLNIMGFHQVVDRCLCGRICLQTATEVEYHGEDIELSILTGNLGNTSRERGMGRDRPINIQPRVHSLMRSSGRGYPSAFEERQHMSGGIPSEEDESTEESHHSENQGAEGRSSSPVILTQPQPSIFIEERETVLFFPGYNHQEQCCSLGSLQSMLVPISMQVMHILKTLALKVYEIPKDTEIHYPTQFVSHRKRQRPLLELTKVSLPGRPRARITTFVDGYPSRLKQKTHSGQVGMVIECTPTARIALAYTCYKDTTKKDFYGMHMVSRVGYTQMKVHQEGLSSLIAVNPTGIGFTGHLSCCYGWGNAKTIRYISSIAQDTRTKGHPDIHLHGGLLQLGYNYSILPSLRITPYIEYMMTHVQWRPYRESSGMFPRELSKNKERIEEKSIGVRNQWVVSDTSCIQTWIAGIVGYRKQSHLHSKLLQAHKGHYEVWLPTRKKQYTRMDVGIAYTIRLMDTVRLALHGKTGFEKGETFKIQQIGCDMQYLY